MRTSALRAVQLAAALMVTAAAGCSSSGTVATHDAAPSASAAAIPQPLVGHWSRTVSQDDFQREGVTPAPPAAACQLQIAARGTIRLDCGSAGADTGTISATGATQVGIAINFGGTGTGGYRWNRTGTHLTVTPFHDTVADRRAVFQGVWTLTAPAANSAWEGRWKRQFGTGNPILTLRQSDASVTGTFGWPWCGDVAGGELSGTAHANSLTATFGKGGSRGKLSVRLSGDGRRLDGTFDIVAGQCRGETHPFHAVKA